MAYRVIFTANETDPVEFEPQDPVQCVGCGEVFDIEDDDIRLREDGEYRCTECEEQRVR